MQSNKRQTNRDIGTSEPTRQAAQNDCGPILVLESLQKRFGEVSILRGASAEVQRGSITAFIGPNGAGKTTLFHTITGDIRPDGGSVLFDGKPLNGKAPWQVARLGLGKMFQDIRIFNNLSVLENVLLALHDHPGQSLAGSLFRAPFRHQASKREAHEAAETLKLIGVEPPWDRPAGVLSFGNQKLLALARLIAGGFHMLLLDEPTSGVAPAMIEKIGELCRRLVSEHRMTIALIEHNFSFVKSVADTVYLLRDGEIVDGGDAAAILDKPENKEILIGL